MRVRQEGCNTSVVGTRAKSGLRVVCDQTYKQLHLHHSLAADDGAVLQHHVGEDGREARDAVLNLSEVRSA